jgi:hypothetical protein
MTLLDERPDTDQPEPAPGLMPTSQGHPAVGNEPRITRWSAAPRGHRHRLLVGGLMAEAMRAQLAVPDNKMIDNGTYNELFTLHGTIMLLFTRVVRVQTGLPIPLMIGARDMAFPG